MDQFELFSLAASSDQAAVRGPARWQLFTDRVMGGVSSGEVAVSEVDGKPCLRMRGDVRLENNGGFVQIATNLSAEEIGAFASHSGIGLEVYGNGESYNVHLRTEAMRRPWQSYRASFKAEPTWHTVRLPFTSFEPHRVDGALQPGEVRRLGLVAIGRAFAPDLCVARVWLYE